MLLRKSRGIGSVTSRIPEENLQKTVSWVKEIKEYYFEIQRSLIVKISSKNQLYQTLTRVYSMPCNKSYVSKNAYCVESVSS